MECRFRCCVASAVIALTRTRFPQHLLSKLKAINSLLAWVRWAVANICKSGKWLLPAWLKRLEDRL